MLEAHGKTLFEHAIKSFERYFRSESFLFLVRDVQGTRGFAEQQAKDLGIQSFKV